MNSLSLNPRFDKFRLAFPKELIPSNIYDKWYKAINRNCKNFFREPIDVINECIQDVELVGISDAGVEQEQTYRNERTGRVEPKGKVTYRTSANVLDLINTEIQVTFRHTSSFYSYFMLFESFFWHHVKDEARDFTPYLAVEILDEDGVPVCKVILKDPVFTGIDPLHLSFNKVDRSSESFNCTFKFSDIDFDIIDPTDENT